MNQRQKVTRTHMSDKSQIVSALLQTKSDSTNPKVTEKWIHSNTNEEYTVIALTVHPKTGKITVIYSQDSTVLWMTNLNNTNPASGAIIGINDRGTIWNRELEDWKSINDNGKQKFVKKPDPPPGDPRTKQQG